jgi:hypothetical protein
MISQELIAAIRRFFYVEHWKWLWQVDLGSPELLVQDARRRQRFLQFSFNSRLLTHAPPDNSFNRSGGCVLFIILLSFMSQDR